MDALRWTSQDLELLPDDGKRYEIVDGYNHHFFQGLPAA